MRNNFKEDMYKHEHHKTKGNKLVDENSIVERLYTKEICKVRERVFSPEESKYNFDTDLRPHMHRLDKQSRRMKNLSISSAINNYYLNH